MSVTLVTNPVQTVGSEVLNLFAGFQPCEFIFKREDMAISLVEQGTDDTILINIPDDLSSYLAVGESIYLYALGNVTGYEYDGNFEILELGTNTIRVDGDFIEQAGAGYINYKKNYYLEVQVIDANNNNVKLLPFTLRDNGDSAGNITIDVSIVNDQNIVEILQESDFSTYNGLVLIDSRIRFKIQYREVYDEATGNYTTITDEIILIYASEQPEREELMNDLISPFLYRGYPFMVALNHSNSNLEKSCVNVLYDTLDINQYDIDVNNLIYRFNSQNDYGILICHFDKSISSGFASNVEFVRFKAEFASLPEYNPEEYTALEYKTY